MAITSRHSYRFVYLRSEQWKTVRIEALANADAKCAICNERSISNDAHHIVYPESFWDTTAEHLIILCRPCHDFVHDILPKKRRNELESRMLWDDLIASIKKWNDAKILWKTNPELSPGIAAIRSECTALRTELTNANETIEVLRDDLALVTRKRTEEEISQIESENKILRSQLKSIILPTSGGRIEMMIGICKVCDRSGSQCRLVNLTQQYIGTKPVTWLMCKDCFKAFSNEFESPETWNRNAFFKSIRNWCHLRTVHHTTRQA